MYYRPGFNKLKSDNKIYVLFYENDKKKKIVKMYEFQMFARLSA